MTQRATVPSDRRAAAGPSVWPARLQESGRLLQRKVADHENPLPHSALNSQSAEAPSIVHDVVNSPGQPLDSRTRDFMEPRFGHDFSQVRVHTDRQAAESARSVNAQAYAVGNNLVFNLGQYAPHQFEGQKLLAHELAHVLQQGSGLQRRQAGLSVASADNAAEGEANTMAEAVMSDRSAPAVQPHPLQISRQATPPTPTPAPASPTVAIGNMRTSTGSNTGTENTCPLCPLPLGILTDSGKNRMELRGDITGHVTGAQYDFKRTKERATWKKVGTTWTQTNHVGPGEDDDAHNDDESLTPVHDHIYVEDGPGLTDLTDPVGDASATEAVYKASFVESCNVKVGTGSWSKQSNDFNWHSITWLEKSGGNWQRKAGSNEISSGSITVGTGGPVAAVAPVVPPAAAPGAGPRDAGAAPGP